MMELKIFATIFSLFILSICIAYKDPFLTYPTNIESIKGHLKMDRPTIAVLSLLVIGRQIIEKIPQAENSSYIAASFVRFIETAGGRAVILRGDYTDEKVDAILKSVNGAILPGGDADLVDAGYDKIAAKVYNYSIEQKRKGVIWPVLGINRGAQRLASITANKDVTLPSDSMNLSLPLHFAPGAKRSRLMKHAAQGIWKTLEKHPMAINVHQKSIPKEIFTNSTELMNFYRIISTNKDRNGTIFVSSFEAKNCPIYCLQWQPEKISFVWNPLLALDHSPDAVRVGQYVANFFMVQARQNEQRFKTRKEEESHLIFSKNPVYIGNIMESPYEQVYLFKSANGTDFGEGQPERFSL